MDRFSSSFEPKAFSRADAGGGCCVASRFKELAEFFNSACEWLWLAGGSSRCGSFTGLSLKDWSCIASLVCGSVSLISLNSSSFRVIAASTLMLSICVFPVS